MKLVAAPFRHRWLAAVPTAASALIACSFVPSLQGAAIALWVSAFAVLAAALVYLGRRELRESGKAPGLTTHRRRLLIFGVLFVSGALVAGTLVDATPSHASPRHAEAPRMIAAMTTGPAVESKLREVAVFAEESTALGRSAVEALVESTRARQVRVESGLLPDFESASAVQIGSTQVLTVPLSGTNLPEVTNLTFVVTPDDVAVVEMVAGMTSDSRVAFSMWQDHVQTKNVIMSQDSDGTSSSTSPSPYGMNWTKFKNCLNNAGINWALVAVISVACSVACATAVLCAPCIAAQAGLTGGTIARCINIGFS
ncbi:hypothetical protein [Frondihabitans cladoniiphilus]|uniref:Uncharacterized protein n=1 Tax=Frondihabitans cladoniiphilus TaxID=715785 RepID=A0ABP8W476_9MICO